MGRMDFGNSFQNVFFYFIAIPKCDRIFNSILGAIPTYLSPTGSLRMLAVQNYPGTCSKLLAKYCQSVSFNHFPCISLGLRYRAL
ncbi:hypothetical protein Nepgr_000712 [Nepenthes gracilis]|uniref:Uncharacterized protein n=1 Tax=Nepenthes gracilis TaxID=150966 RepID=A0AAD3P3W2_NEPGR|nr:hypothetical protein Nepgr_000712 [Nepenthes gracilis]